MRSSIRWVLPGLLLAAAGCDDGGAPPAAVDGGGAAECAPGESRPCPLGGAAQRCIDGLWGPCAAIAEMCDGVDEDGDGAVDEGLVAPCGSAVGACQPGLKTCTDGVWSACVGAIGPGLERCDGRDDDCDGAVDEAPILGPVTVIDSPVMRGPDALVWTGRAYAASLPGYPNWVMRFAPDGTVWRADLFGRVPAAIDLAAGPDGLAVAWAERDGTIMLGVAGWGAPGWGPEPVGPDGTRAGEVQLAGETRSTLLAWIDDEGLPWAQVFDPADGSPRFGAMRLGGPAGALGIRVANNGEDGFAATWRIAETGAVWFSRLNNSGAPVVSFEIASAGATSVAVLADYYVDAFGVVWSEGDRVRIARIARGAGRVGRIDDVAVDEPGAGELRAVRDDTVWSFFWRTSDGIRGRLFERDGTPSTDAFDVMPGGERFAVAHGSVTGYAIATVREGRFETRTGPVVCPPPEEMR